MNNENFLMMNANIDEQSETQLSAGIHRKTSNTRNVQNKKSVLERMDAY